MYPSNYGTPMVNFLTFKLLLDSRVSTPGAHFMTIDIKDFYLNTPMNQFEYTKLYLGNLP